MGVAYTVDGLVAEHDAGGVAAIGAGYKRRIVCVFQLLLGDNSIEVMACFAAPAFEVVRLQPRHASVRIARSAQTRLDLHSRGPCQEPGGSWESQKDKGISGGSRT